MKRRKLAYCVAQTFLIAVLLGGLLAVLPGTPLQPNPSIHTIEFDTDEGTFINVDVSPDGHTLAFDLLGDIYTLPISGGTARPLLAGQSWDRCPRYSPDGRRIAFISDRSGPDRVWAWDLITNKGRQISSVDPEQYLDPWSSTADGTPAWLPDGSKIAFGVHAEDSRIRMVPVGSGHSKWLEESYPPGVPVKGAKFGVHSVTFTPDGHYGFFSETRVDRSLWVAQTSIDRLDLATQQRILWTRETDGRQEFKPQVSASGKFLAYARRNRPGDTELRVRDLQTSLDRRLTKIDDCDPWRWGDRGDEMPAYAFTPDDRFLVIAIGGKLHKISVSDGADTPIPFNLHVVREVARPIRAHYRIPDGPMQVKAIRWPSISPDGKKLVFSAVGHLYSQELPNGKPRRLADREDFEYMPSLSPDGSTVAYVSFPRTPEGTGPGSLMTLKLSEKGPRRISSDGGTYFLPSWSPDGRRLAVIRHAELKRNSPGEFGWVDLATGAFHRVADAPSNDIDGNQLSYSQLISFSNDGARLLFSHQVDWKHLSLESANLDGTAKREVAHAGKDIQGILPAPDLSRAVLIGWDENAYVVDLPAGAKQPIGLKLGDERTRKISGGCAYFPVWRGTTSFTYSCSNRVFRYEIREKRVSTPVVVDLQVGRKEGAGLVAFRNARIITVAGSSGGGQVIERGTILIGGRRIVAVGESATVTIPPDANVVEATGLTIMPGLIDAHYHGMGGAHTARLIPAPSGQLGDPSGLAYGVTTGWEALGGKNDGPQSLAEMREVGLVKGPRWFFAIEEVNDFDDDSSPSILSFEAARAMVERRADNGVLQVVKEYSESNRTTARWFAEAARQNGLGIAAHTEGLSHLLKRTADGYDAEHAFVPVPLYKDVLQFLARTGTIWTPTMTIAHGTATPGNIVENQLFPELVRQRGVRSGEKLDLFAGQWLQEALDNEKLAANKAIPPYEQTTVAGLGRTVADALAAGVKVAISGHNSPGILTHFEMWVLRRGGASNADVIRAATMTGAEKLGIQQDVGSLEPGKIADFLVLTSNPLEKIENSIDLKYTVADGVIYDSNTLEIVHPN